MESKGASGLWVAGYGDLAIADRPLALSVALHKGKFLAEKDFDGKWID